MGRRLALAAAAAAAQKFRMNRDYWRRVIAFKGHLNIR
jgi:hypothetical protein